MSNNAIKVSNLHKGFRLPTEKSSSIKQSAINLFKGVKGYKEQKVLRGIDLEIKKGDFFGIIGRNGSGKSTLLKLLAGIYHPDKGKIEVEGVVVPFIELGVGFNPELTGRENVYLNGALFGFSNKEVDAMYDEIVDFAELHEFMEQKLKNYSSGMQVRLAFSIAIKAQGDILILDEVLAVGDESFQRKCFSYFAELKRNKKTVVLVTHSMDSVQQYCTKAVLVENGRIIKSGNTNMVAQAYRELFMKDEVKTKHNNHDGVSDNKNLSAKVKYKNNLKKLSFDISITSKINLNDVVITFVINRDNGEIVYRWTSDEKLSKDFDIKKGKKISLNVEIDNIFPNGVFSVDLGIKNRNRTTIYGSFAKTIEFEIINRGSYNNDIFWKPTEKVEIKEH